MSGSWRHLPASYNMRGSAQHYNPRVPSRYSGSGSSTLTCSPTNTHCQWLTAADTAPSQHIAQSHAQAVVGGQHDTSCMLHWQEPLVVACLASPQMIRDLQRPEQSRLISVMSWWLCIQPKRIHRCGSTATHSAVHHRAAPSS